MKSSASPSPASHCNPTQSLRGKPLWEITGSARLGISRHEKVPLGEKNGGEMVGCNWTSSGPTHASVPDIIAAPLRPAPPGVGETRPPVPHTLKNSVGAARQGQRSGANVLRANHRGMHNPR